MFFFSSRRRHTRFLSDWSSDVCSSDLLVLTDRRPDPSHLTQVVGVRDGEIVLRADLRSMVADDAAIVVGDMLFAAGRSEERRVGKGCECGSGIGRRL